MFKGNSKYGFLLLWFQGIYFFITGIWPMVNIESFMMVSGYKTDIWLVKTVGLQVTSISIGLLSAAYYKNISLPIILVAICSALSFILIDIFYVWKNIISKVYLGDAAIELLILVNWLLYLFNDKIIRLNDKYHLVL